MNSDPALESLLRPLLAGQVSWPAHGGALFLNARGAEWLRQLPTAGLRCQQSFKPEFDALQATGFDVVCDTEADARFPVVMLLPPRQREAARALYARAACHLAPDGNLLVSQTNDEGARSCESDLRQLFGSVQTESKQRCRLMIAEASSLNETLRAQWLALDAPRPILDGRLCSRPGVFAWDRIDAASKLLVEQLPDTLAGHAADLGAGWGYLSTELLRRCPAIRSIDLFEADARALAMAEHNLHPLAGDRRLAFHWHDVTRGIDGEYDVILSNPPFHAQTASDRPDIGRAFIERACDALTAGGCLWLVANRHLPYESVLEDRFATVRCVIQQDGFKVICANGARRGRRA